MGCYLLEKRQFGHLDYEDEEEPNNVKTQALESEPGLLPVNSNHTVEPSFDDHVRPGSVI